MQNNNTNNSVCSACIEGISNMEAHQLYGGCCYEEEIESQINYPNYAFNLKQLKNWQNQLFLLDKRFGDLFGHFNKDEYLQNIICDNNNTIWFFYDSLPNYVKIINIHQQIGMGTFGTNCTTLNNINISPQIMFEKIKSSSKITNDSILITEPGIYQLLRISRHNIAKSFTTFVDNIMLPHIRMNGTFQIDKAIILQYKKLTGKKN